MALSEILEFHNNDEQDELLDEELDRWVETFTSACSVTLQALLSTSCPIAAAAGKSKASIRNRERNTIRN